MSANPLSVEIRTELPGFSLRVADTLDLAGVTAVYGPSGSGKSTLLRSIAGFEQPTAGRIALGENVWFDHDSGVNIPPHRRPIGYMFQDPQLFPHLSVSGNLSYADKRSQQQPGLHFEQVVDAFALESLLDRSVKRLSGGEQQRVALARTLLTRPRLLLLDEPLAALDRARKRDIMPFLEDLPQRFGVPLLYVSHDIEEVTHLADQMLVLVNGQVQVHGQVTDVINRLDREPLAAGDEVGSLLEGTLVAVDQRLQMMRIELPMGTLNLPSISRLTLGSTVRLRIQARDVAIALQPPTGLSIRNILAATVVQIVERSDSALAEVFLDLNPKATDASVGAGLQLRALVTRAAAEDLELTVGLSVFALVKSVSFDDRLG